MKKKKLADFIVKNRKVFSIVFVFLFAILCVDFLVQRNTINKLEKQLHDTNIKLDGFKKNSDDSNNNDIMDTDEEISKNIDASKNNNDFETELEILSKYVGETEVKKVFLGCNDYKIDDENNVSSCYALTTSYMSFEPFYTIYNLKNKKNNQTIVSNNELLEIFKLDEKEFIEFYKKEYLKLFRDDNEKYLKYIETLDKNSNEYKTSISNYTEANEKISNINSSNIDSIILYINENDKLEFLISNDLWSEKRPQTGWRQGDTYISKRITLK